MDLEYEIRAVMRDSENALTVEQVTQEIAERLKQEIRTTLNRLVKAAALDSVHGGGGYPTTYRLKSPKIDRRF
jgi:coproporphyrinogen III oxidase-like Fe-S oxidoreductase